MSRKQKLTGPAYERPAYPKKSPLKWPEHRYGERVPEKTREEEHKDRVLQEKQA